jgi:hypothetical protein
MLHWRGSLQQLHHVFLMLLLQFYSNVMIAIVTNLLGSISQWKFITLRVQYTTLDYSSQLF